MTRCYIDHLTITSPTLEKGAKYVFESLGVKPQEGGEHEKMGTHNLLLRLGSSTYLEVIAINPNAPSPDSPRWFDLDKLREDSEAALATWVAQTQDIKSSVESCSEDIGDIEPMSRGDLNWLITIPKDGELIMDGVAPALIQWQTARHPAENLIDFGLGLLKLELHHPEPRRVSAMLDSINFKGPLSVKSAGQLMRPHMQAVIETPDGIRRLVTPNQ